MQEGKKTTGAAKHRQQQQGPPQRNSGGQGGRHTTGRGRGQSNPPRPQVQRQTAIPGGSAALRTRSSYAQAAATQQGAPPPPGLASLGVDRGEQSDLAVISSQLGMVLHRQDTVTTVLAGLVREVKTNSDQINAILTTQDRLLADHAELDAYVRAENHS